MSARRLYEKRACLRCGHWFYAEANASGGRLFCSTCRDVEEVERRVSLSRARPK